MPRRLVKYKLILEYLQLWKNTFHVKLGGIKSRIVTQTYIINYIDIGRCSMSVNVITFHPSYNL